MKRSEVVKLIASTIGNLDKALMSNNLKADVILYEIEKLGMLPPEAEVLVQTKDFESWSVENQWEKE